MAYKSEGWVEMRDGEQKPFVRVHVGSMSSVVLPADKVTEFIEALEEGRAMAVYDLTANQNGLGNNLIPFERERIDRPMGVIEAESETVQERDARWAEQLQREPAPACRCGSSCC
jgi:hypothetical protein